MTEVVQPFYFPPPVDIDRNTMQEAADILGQRLATQLDLDPIRSLAANTAVIVQKQQQDENVGSGGVNKLLTFGGSGALSTTDWTSDPAVYSQSSGQMALTGSAPNGLFLARANYAFATDNQAVTFQLGDNANNDQYTYHVLRASADGRQGVALRVSANSLAIGTINFPSDGSAVATSSGFTTAMSVTRTQSSSDGGEFRAIGNDFSVLINGSPIPGLTYSGPLGSVGSSWRGASVIKQRAQGAFGIVFYSFNLRSFGMYDYGTTGASATNRTNAKLSRSSTQTVPLTVANGGYALMPANYYSTTDSLVGMTVTDIGAGKVRVDTADWYEVEASFTARYFSAATLGSGGKGDEWWGQSHFCLYVNDVQYTQALICGVPHRFQFAAGDVIQVGIANVTVTLGATVNTADSNYSVPRPANVTGIGGGPGSFFQISKSYQ